jgi:hypothetical protein
MAKWRKLGKVFDPRDYKGIPWLDEYAQAPATLIFDVFRVVPRVTKTGNLSVTPRSSIWIVTIFLK